MADGVGGLGQREAAGDVRLDLAGGVHRQQFGDALLVPRRVLGDPGSPEHADDVATLQQRQVQRDLRDVAGGEPDHQILALPGDGAQRGFRVVAADTVIDHVGAGRAAGRLELFGKLLLAVAVEGAAAIDHPGVGAVGEAKVDLLLAGGGGDDPRAHLLAELDGGKADAAGRAQHQQRLAGLQIRPVLQRVVAGAVGHDEGRGVIEGHGVGDLHQPRGLQRQFLGHAAPAGVAQHPVADLDVGDPLADRLDDAGDLAARRERPRRLELVLILDNQHVGEVHPHRLDRHNGEAGLGLRARHVLQHQGVRAAHGLAQQRLHIRLPVVFLQLAGR